jgi:anti-sigma B factor antagonist
LVTHLAGQDEETQVGPLVVKYRKMSGVAVFELEGDLDLSTVGLLREKVARAFEDHYKDLVMVLDGLDFMDSAGLGVLVGVLKQARAREGSVGLVCSKTFLVRTLQITGLDRVFTVRGSLDDLVGTAAAESATRRRLFGRGRSL